MVEVTQFKKNDLYIYELSANVLDSLKLVTFDATLHEVDPVPTATAAANGANAQTTKPTSDSLECNVCGMTFETLQRNREHRRTDLHTYNVKRNMKDLSPIGEDKFQDLISSKEGTPHATDIHNPSADDDQEDRDNDESESDEFYREQSNFLDDLLEDEVTNMSIDDNSGGVVSHLNTRSPQIYFNSTLLQNSDAFGIYKALFTEDQAIKPLQSVKEWNFNKDQSSTVSALFMVGGGHFAGAIVSHQRANVNGNARKQDQSLQEQAVVFLEHKTFHRYTTRRKQGGSQSAMDQAKGKANSAGSDLRRYNEAALKLDIKNLLAEWEPYLRNCENVFLRATNIHERKVFTDNREIKKIENKVKSFPFTTGRPTVAELKRSWCELSYLKKVAKPQPLALKEPNVSSDITKTSKNEDKEPSKEISPEELHTKELLQFLKKAKAPLLVAYLRKRGLDVNFRLAPKSQYSVTPTMLHFAAQQGLRQMVTILISNLKSDPCIENEYGKTAWDLAKSSDVKYAFQLARHKLGENYTDWSKSHIDKPLSREDIDILNKEKLDNEKKETDEAIKRELENVRERQKAELEAKRGSGRTLEGNGPPISQNLNSLSEDQRRRLMREQRARAAEARMQKR